MPTNILMPALSPTMEKGNLAKWLKKEGERVKAGDVIAEIETDKATMEVEAVDEGVLAKIVVPEGTQDVPVNDVIAVLAGEGEDAKAIAGGAGAPTPSPAAKPAVPAPRADDTRAPEPSKAKPQPIQDSGPTPAAAPVSGTSKGNGHGRRIFASPLARRLAKDANLDLGRLSGSGPHGRIVASDIAAAKSGGAPMRAPATAPAAAPAVQAPSDAQIRALYEEGGYEFVPHDSMRKTIAKRLLESKLTIPHYYLTVDCDIDTLLEARKEINSSAPKTDGKPRFKLSVNDFIIKALALALIKVPNANVTWTEAGMLKHNHADVGVAVALDGGLFTPIVRRAEEKTLSAISNEMKDLAARARTKKLKPHEFQGGATSVSNLGMYGIRDFIAVINPPQSSILAVGMGEPRIVVRNNKPAVATLMTVTLSADHRAVDGALGAELLAAFKEYIEHPVEMLA